MNYHEMLDRLSRGELSRDEAALLEKEIERHEAIEDYLANRLDDEIRPEPDDDTPADMAVQAIARGVKKRFRRMGMFVFLAVLLTAALCIGIFFAVRVYWQSASYDPNDGVGTSAIYNASGQFYIDMRAYLELFCPGYTLISAEAIPEGGGTYALSATLTDTFTWKNEPWTDTLVRGKLKAGYESLWPYPIGNAFGYREGWIRTGGQTGDAGQRQTYTDELSRLPETTRAAAYYTFTEPLTLEALKTLMDEHPDLTITYAAVKTNDDYRPYTGYTMGFNPYGMFYLLEYDSFPDPEKYPYYELSSYSQALEENPAPIWEEHFKTLLRLMRDSSEFRRAMTPLGEGVFGHFEEELTYIEENGVTIYGIYATGQAQAVLELEKSSSIFSFYVDNVMFSSLAKSR